MSVLLRRGPFTVESYHRLAEAGILGEDDRVELLDGQIVQMTPIGADHAASVDALTRLLVRAVGDAAIVRVQNPIVLDPRSEPQPDLALLRPHPTQYHSAHPSAGDILLVIEVADSSLAFDRKVKLPYYAAAGIPEAWLVDLEHDTVEVHRQPSAEAYTEVQMLGRGETLRPNLIAEATIPINDVLGPPRRPGGKR
jgi:Uma2 family endonuclease